jgi:DNA modification methylase
MHNEIYIGDCREILKTLPDKSVHCCVTSPPYYGLRDYQTASWEGGIPECDHVANHNATKKFGNPVFNANRPSREETKTSGYYKDICPKCGAVRIDKQIGLEKTPEEYVSELVNVFREVKRVLRDDGTLFLNLGDSYAGSVKGQYKEGEHDPKKKKTDGMKLKSGNVPCGLKPKDLIGIPWRVAFALQADGWYLRSDIIWAKNNPMPESVTDRPTRSHEYIFLFSKSAKYFYDSEAIKEDSVSNHNSGNGFKRSSRLSYQNSDMSSRGNEEQWKATPKRNKRSVWNINTKPYKGAHFATFPQALIEPCIKAGTSEFGVCSECGSHFLRITENNVIHTRKPENGIRAQNTNILGQNGANSLRDGYRTIIKNTVGFKPSCSCNAPSIPSTVLDPFAGSGTVGEVCNKLGRKSILIELNPEYKQLIEQRIKTE